MKVFTLLAILALLLGIASPLPIWPGPLFLRHLSPGIASAILMIFACLGSMKKGSKIVGIIAIIYGLLASLAGAIFTVVVMFMHIGIIYVGLTTIVLIIGMIILILGYKTLRATRRMK